MGSKVSSYIFPDCHIFTEYILCTYLTLNPLLYAPPFPQHFFHVIPILSFHVTSILSFYVTPILSFYVTPILSFYVTPSFHFLSLPSFHFMSHPSFILCHSLMPFLMSFYNAFISNIPEEVCNEYTDILSVSSVVPPVSLYKKFKF